MGRNRLQSGVMLLQVSDFCALHVSVVGEEPASITSWTLRRFCCPCPLLLFKGGTWQKGSSYRLIWEIMIKFSQWATLPVSEFPLFSPPLMSQENWDDETFKWKCLSLSRVRLFVTPWTVACQAPLSMGFSRQEYWNGLPFPSPGTTVTSCKISRGLELSWPWNRGQQSY